ncbi:Pentulose kinase [Metschnikowia bicuspidata var. bicuspidata NRRL YB-4993]|uniref:Pentulose kinase n=1 Tax=Metschnikowia bicuspidata var. bicuspidata NRRL YB-4993 TaxID=869754 RepID=A0A1A0HJS5_9ASCO|nr:Pentulose kinase [Metschnikowia bicuspidata var. bicuspidata NRRL YB-4993]OBA24270.1 Pentulose kinase [Metschnikowia bicuspidata var. bicuspidata NRRL YB-4993]
MAYNRSHTSLNSRRLSFFNSHQLAHPPQPDVYFVGVDVGTGSARACVIDTNGVILGLAERPITRHQLKPNHITQNSTEIWNSICYCVKTCLRDSGVDAAEVFGIGFDATCSLVAVAQSTDQPAGVGPDFADSKENIVLWMDHRADSETNAINATGDKALKYVGGQMSIEMELPKIKWLKHHRPGGLDDLKFYDLPDYLTHKATGSEARSYNSTVCKQGLVPIGVDGSTEGWSRDFLRQIDLPELVADDFAKLGGIPGRTGTWLSAGDVVGKLTPQAAEDLGLTTECVVGSGVIDAYAGWIGTVAGKVDLPSHPELLQESDGSMSSGCGRLAAVAGTSTCHIAMSEQPCFVKGVWGPYREVFGPGYWLAEGGQSCTGALLAHVLSIHPSHGELVQLAEASNLSKFDYLNLVLENMVSEHGSRSVVALAKHIFFYGDFHGNRSPIADPHMRASIIGQSMDSSVKDLALQYFGACEFIAQQTRQIVEEMEKGGHSIKCVYMSGGQCRNGLLMRLLADCTGLPVIVPRYIDAAVVFGSALLGAVAALQMVDEHISTKGRSRRASLLKSQTDLNNMDSKQKAQSPPHSPYTAPSATASSTNMAAFAYTSANHHNQFTMSPLGESTGEQDYFNQTAAKPAKSDGSESDSDEDETLSFGSKQNTSQTVQKDLSHKLFKMGIKPLTSSTSAKKQKKPEHQGDKLWQTMEKLTGPGRAIIPSPESHPDRRLLAAKYKIFLEQCYKQQEYRKLVDEVEASA